MELTRRECLKAAAGLALALQGCGRRPGAITGRIVGGADARGHLLRDGAGWKGAPGAREEVPVVIAGGGVAGLSAAWKLDRSGVRDFLVLDLEDAAGGTAASGENAVSRYPWGAHYVPVPTREQRALVELLEEIGVTKGFDAEGRAVAREEHLCRAPDERLFYRGAWTEGLYLRDGASAEDRRQLERFEAETRQLAAWRDGEGRRAFAIPLARSSNAHRDLDRTSMAEWLGARGYDSPRLLWFVEYACRDDYGCRLDTTSAWAALHYFASRLAGPQGDAAEFLTWPDGNGFLVRHLLRHAEGRVRCGAVVTAIEPLGDRVAVRYLDVAAGLTREIVAEHVVCALPRFVARRVVTPLAGEGGGFRYAPWVVANLTLRSRPRDAGFPLAWDNVLYESESLGYVVATHQTDRRGPESVWTWYRPFPGPDPAAERARVLATSWEGWRDEILRDLGRAHPDLSDHVTTIDVWRWGHAMIRPEPGFLWGGARERAAAPIGRIHFAGADLGLPLFEEAQWHGVRAAEEVLTVTGKPFVSSL